MGRKNRKVRLQDEGSWALMIEESNAKAIYKYHGNMADLDIDYYLSTGTNRWYKAFFDESTILENRKNMKKFLLNDQKYDQCINGINDIMQKMKKIDEQYSGKDLYERFCIYCDVLCDYIAFYNSVIADTFYQEIYDMADDGIPKNLGFAANMIKDSLFSTDNNALLSHTQNVDLTALAERFIKGEEISESIHDYVVKYKSTTASSANPNGISEEEVLKLVKDKNEEEVELEKAFFENLKFRYDHVDEWSERTAKSIGISEDTEKIIRRTSHLSYIKILMRECFQDFKIATRENFLTELIKTIGKKNFDYMLIDEIKEFIQTGECIGEDIISGRKNSIVFEVDSDDFNILGAVPEHVKIEEIDINDVLTGDVLIGSGIGRYKVRVIEQNEEGLNEFNEYIEATKDKENVALITNVLRPFLVPKLKKFGVLLTQYGGYTSHASVLCREMGINSVVSVNGLMNALKTGDFIEIDYNKGIIKKIDEMSSVSAKFDGVSISLNDDVICSKSDVGNKAFNLIRINRIANTPKGFVLTPYAVKNIDDISVQNEVMREISKLDCDLLAIRSSHEGEDGENASCAGLFESYVNIDAHDRDKVIECIKGVYGSQNADHLRVYRGEQDGDMHVIIQEMISADISGVMLTSFPFFGKDYLMIEYAKGDLCHVMQGDITPLSSYVQKEDVLAEKEDYHCYPEMITSEVKKELFPLLSTAIVLEQEYSHRVEIEWGIRNKEVYIFQVRTY